MSCKVNLKSLIYPNVTITILRVFIGIIFIYAGVFKAGNPSLFARALSSYGILSVVLIGILKYVVPFIEILVGILFLVNIVTPLISILSILLLLGVFNLMTIIGVYKGNLGGCGCFPESFFLNFDDPYLILVRNLFLGSIAGVVLLNTKFSLIKKKANTVMLANVFLLVSSLSFITLLFARTNVESRLYNAYETDRHVTLDYIRNNDLDKTNIIEDVGIPLPQGSSHKNILLFVINSFSCKSCADEAIYTSYLSNNYSDNLYTIAVTSIRSKTAISNFIERNSLSYPIIHNSTQFSKLLQNINTLKILADNEGKIILIDPATYRSKKLRENFEESIVGYRKGGE